MMTEKELTYLALLNNSLREIRTQIIEENNRYQHQLAGLYEKFDVEFKAVSAAHLAVRKNLDSELRYIANSHKEAIAAQTSKFKSLLGRLESFSARSWEENLFASSQLESCGEDIIEV
jgi:hypothetical protein